MFPRIIIASFIVSVCFLCLVSSTPMGAPRRDQTSELDEQQSLDVKSQSGQQEGPSMFGWVKDKLFGDPSDKLPSPEEDANLSDRTLNRNADNRQRMRGYYGGQPMLRRGPPPYVDAYYDARGGRGYQDRSSPLSMPVVLLFLLIVVVCIAVVVIEANYHILDGLFRVVDEDNLTAEERLEKYGGPSTSTRERKAKKKRKRRSKDKRRKSHKSKRRADKEEEDEDEEEENDDEEEEEKDDEDDRRRRREKKSKKRRKQRHPSSHKKKKKSKRKKREDDDSSSPKRKHSKRGDEEKDDSN